MILCVLHGCDTLCSARLLLGVLHGFVTLCFARLCYLVFCTVLLLGVLHGCDTGSLPLKEGHRLRMMSRRIFSVTN